MATWEDGPEYAPRERPLAFAVPAAAPLKRPAAEPSLADGAPPARPTGWDQDPRAAIVPQRRLDELSATSGPGRDPHDAFTVTSSTVTSQDSVWGAVHQQGQSRREAFDPLRPMSEVAGPAAGAVSAAPVQAVATEGVASQITTSMTPAMLITLLVGVIVPTVAPVSFLCAWALTGRVRADTLRLARLRVFFRSGALVLALWALYSLLTTSGIAADWWAGIGLAAEILCLVAIAVTLILVAPQRPKA